MTEKIKSIVFRKKCCDHFFIFLLFIFVFWCVLRDFQLIFTFFTS